MSDAVIHNRAKSSFELTIAGHMAEATYVDRGEVWVMNHTFVPDALRGQGIAGRLVDAAFAAAREAGVKIDPQCSYVATYMDRHPETAELRA